MGKLHFRRADVAKLPGQHVDGNALCTGYIGGQAHPGNAIVPDVGAKQLVIEQGRAKGQGKTNHLAGDRVGDGVALEQRLELFKAQAGTLARRQDPIRIEILVGKAKEILGDREAIGIAVAFPWRADGDAEGFQIVEKIVHIIGSAHHEDFV